MIDTPLLVVDRAGVERLVATIPAARVGEAREVAEAIAFLLSDAARYVVGAHLTIDGGLLT